MAEKKQLKNDPITEALIDIRVKLPANFDVTAFDDLDTKELKEYSVKERQTEFSADLKVVEDQPLFKARSKGVRGFLYKSEDNKNIVQFRVDGFTFNRLRPYTTWEEMVGAAKELWQVYTKYSAPIQVTRIATRFINHIKLPLPIEDFATYMNAPPQNPSKQDVVAGYLTRIKLMDKKNDIGTNIIQTFEKGTENRVITLLLDIDTYSNKNYKADDPGIWDQFDKLRIKKNDIFFDSLTDKAINLHL